MTKLHALWLSSLAPTPTHETCTPWNHNSAKTACVVFVFCVVAAISSPAQTFTTLFTFDLTDGAFPYGALVQGLDGNFYNTTMQGNGRNQCYGGCGTVFKITPQGTLTTLHNFKGTDGGYPVAGLVLGVDGNFYGSTFGDPPFFSGISFIFEITPDGTLTNLAQTNFGSTASPSPLMQNLINGTFYGTGACDVHPSCPLDMPGTVFSMTQSGFLTVLHNFCGEASCGGIAKGANPQAPLIQGTDLFMYGTTQFGGNDLAQCQSLGCGKVFKIGTGGNVTTLHAFDPSNGDGTFPEGALVEGGDGNVYGTTSAGGANGYGTVFKMTPAGALTTLYNFGSQEDFADGVGPSGGLIQATDGNFYGTTKFGGANGYISDAGFGTVFQITPEGTLTTIHSFDETEGMWPQAGLVQGTDGNLYGVATGTVATHAWGTVFKISMGLAPFAKTVPVAAYPGKQIFILGTNLMGATSVTFGGTPAAFTVVSATEITATVPKSATTGTVQVVTPSGTLSSNVPFRVF
jgi:uncharacterized repeat protein (TIGR03803 family)